MTEENADINYKTDARFELKDIPPVSIENVSPEGYVQVHLLPKQDGKRGCKRTLRHRKRRGRGRRRRMPRGRVYRKRDKDACRKNEGDQLRRQREIHRLRRYRGVVPFPLGRCEEDCGNSQKEGIPINEGAFGQSVSLPERELVNFLRVLDNPRQDVAFAGYLLSFSADTTRKKWQKSRSKKATVCTTNF